MTVYCAQWEMGLSKREPSGFEIGREIGRSGRPERSFLNLKKKVRQ
jgi:hypothetical protein